MITILKFKKKTQIITFNSTGSHWFFRENRPILWGFEWTVASGPMIPTKKLDLTVLWYDNI
jgi:hypothetical protein